MRDTSKMTLNERIAFYRKMNGMRQQDVAEALHLKTSTYSQLERTGNITVSRLKEIAAIIETDIQVLLGGEEVPTKERGDLGIEPEIESISWEKQLVDIARELSEDDRKKLFNYCQSLTE